jgi:hypothetical protein
MKARRLMEPPIRGKPLNQNVEQHVHHRGHGYDEAEAEG